MRVRQKVAIALAIGAAVVGSGTAVLLFTAPRPNRLAAVDSSPIGPTSARTNLPLFTRRMPGLPADPARESSTSRYFVVSGRIVSSSSGEPIPGAAIRAGARGTLSGDHGLFVLPGVTAELPSLEVSAAGYRSRTTHVAPPAATGALVSVGDIALEGGGRIRVHVTDSDGVAVARARVAWALAHREWSPAGENGGVDSTPESPLRATFEETDDSGTAVLSVPSGIPLVLLARAERRGWIASTPVQVRGNELLDYHFSLPRTVSLTVRLALPLRARAPVTITVEPTDFPSRHLKRTTFDFVEPAIRIDLPRGTYRVSARLVRYPLEPKLVELQEDTTIIFDVGNPRVVDLSVTDEGGRPIPEFRCRLVPAPTPEPSGDEVWDEILLPLLFGPAGVVGHDGHVILTEPPEQGLEPAASALIAVLADSHSAATQLVRFAGEGQATRASIRLRSAARVQGSLRGATAGTLVDLFLLSLRGSPYGWRQDDAPVVASARIDGLAGFSLSGMGAGLYEIRAGEGPWRRTLGRIELPDSGTVSVVHEWVECGLEVLGSTARTEIPDSLLRLDSLSGAGAVSILVGVRTGVSVQFQHVPPGEYVVGWRSDLDSLAAMRDVHLAADSGAPAARGEDVHWVRIKLAAGDSTQLVWRGVGPPVQSRARLEIPDALKGRHLVATVVPDDRLQRMPGRLRWRPVHPDGTVAMEASPGRGVWLVVAVVDAAHGPGVATGGLSPVLCHRIEDMVRAGEAAPIVVPVPAVLRLSGASGARQAWVRPAVLSQVLEWSAHAILGRGVVEIDTLLPGTMQLLVNGADPEDPKRGKFVTRSLQLADGGIVDASVDLLGPPSAEQSANSGPAMPR